MDHVPLPESPNDSHISVLVRENTLYPYTYSPPWHSYPERQGYDVADFYATMGNQHPEWRATFACFMQSWLYFGLMAEFLGHLFVHDDWVRQRGDGVQTVSTALMPRRLDVWRQQVLVMPDAQKSRLKSDVDYLLDRAHQFHSMLTKSADFTRTTDLLPRDLSLSIQILIATLIVARNSVFSGIPTKIRTHGIFMVLSEQFQSNGWCASDVARLRQDTSVLGEYYASRLGRLPLRRDHSLCDEDTCLAAQIKMETYKTQHTTAECSCTFLGFETTRLAGLLVEDDIPLIALEAEQDCRIASLTVRGSSAGYVAISHVWADGLGNPASNRLPRCQLRRIQHQVNALYDDKESAPNHPFWIDTICVPVGQEFWGSRNKAIAGMANVYRSADRVLILNHELQEIDSRRDMTELATRAARTLWFRRLWTLHEGVLSRNLYFQFKEGAVSLQNMLDACNQPRALITFEDHLKHTLLREACTPMLKLSTFKAVPYNERISHIWAAVQWRSTSNLSDETICLANLLGLSLDTILAISRDSHDVQTERMKAFICLQKYFPSNSLFESQKTRGYEVANLNVPGYQWAPKSFVSRSVLSRADSNKTQLASADEKGLRVSFPGFKMMWDDVAGGKHAIAFTISQDWDYWYSVSWLQEGRDAWAVDPALMATSYPAIIIDKDLAALNSKGQAGTSFSHDAMMTGDINSFTIDLFFETCDGAFVVVKDEEDMLEGTFVGRVMVYRREFKTFTEPAWAQVDGLAEDDMASKADLRCFERLLETQKWCIG